MKCFNFFKTKKEGSSGPGLRNHGNKVGNNSDLSKKSSRSLPSPRSVLELYKEKEHNLRVFTFSELKRATDGFSKFNKIGEGGFGKVYKGSIMPANGGSDPIVVAIKKLNQLGMQGHKEWSAEVQCLGIVDHPNLVKLLGYCAVNGDRGIQRLLVYEYVTNKSLEDHLFNRMMPPLPWITRLRIILGAAQGLAYLHEGMEVQVIYRDFKSSNVLLDDDFRPKLSDFGLAREGPTGDRSHVSTGPVGTYGYAAPEYIETSQLTYKSDVWSFGVVLYEILTGRRSLELKRPAVEQKLLQWVKLYPADSKGFHVIIDPRLKNQYSLASARKIATLADSCLNKNAKERPDMREVIERLKDAIKDCENGSSFQKRNAAVSSLPSPRMNSPKNHPLPLPPKER